MTLPDRQTAAVVEEPGPQVRVVVRDDIPISEPGVHQILVKMECTGICGSEVRALTALSPCHSIIGHEGVGVVVRAGPEVDPSMLHQRVGIKWLLSACGTCSSCTRGFPNYCPRQSNAGRDAAGTLQQYVIADARFVTTIPEGVPSEIAAPLLCAGLTISGAISRIEGEVFAGDWIVILGSGGGLGHIGVQMASRLCGYRVIAVDTGEAKRDLSLSSGAEAFVDFATEDVAARVKELTGDTGASAVFVVPASEEAFQISPQLVRNMGIIVCIGLPRNDFNFPISATVCAARGLTITGVCVGVEIQMEELLHHAEEGILQPSIQLFDLPEVSQVLERIIAQDITGRAVIRLPQ